VRLPDPCLVVLIGVAGAGKSSWARNYFRAEAIVSTDELRAVVGRHRLDLSAHQDAVEVLELVVAKRLRRRLLTVVDSTGLDAAFRRRMIGLAAAADVPCHAVIVDTPEREARARNKQRPEAVPSKVLTQQLQSLAATVASLDEPPNEGFDAVHRASDGPPAVVPTRYLDAPAAAARQREEPMPLTFGLHIGRFTWPGAPAETAQRLRTIATAAEAAGFTTLSVMDHMVQIPTVGREWEDMYESTATLGYLAAATSTIRLGTLVHGVTYRNLAHLAKLTATLDVLSGGRAFCGVGAAWFKREHELYGWEFPPIDRRYALLEDALRLLPLMWGPGAPRFEGRTTTIPAATCYPRPLQERIPIVVGGSGERRTLRLAARYADACNLFGEPDVVRHKVGVLHAHCDDAGRDRAAVQITHLSEAAILGIGDATERDDDAIATVDEHTGRYRELAEAGVQHAVVALHLDGTPSQVEAFAPVIAAFIT
jgi:F420-dependent oxidoreductase-like protein